MLYASGRAHILYLKAIYEFRWDPG